MTIHTPGPWKASDEDEFGDITIQPASGGLAVAAVVNASFMAMGGKEAEHAANARLIAAAPELLSTLKTVLVELEDEVERRGDNDDDYDLPLRPAMKKVRAVIALAEGRPI